MTTKLANQHFKDITCTVYCVDENGGEKDFKVY